MPPITPLNPIPSTASTSSGTTGAPTSTPQNPGSILDRDAFLKLLVAQLKYQDPTNPTDASSMMAQTSQLTMVERLDDINQALGAAADTDRLTLAGTMVGRQISFQGESGPITASVDSVRFVNGQFVLSAGGYAVPMEAVIEVGSSATATAPARTAPAPATSSPASGGSGDATTASPGSPAADGTDAATGATGATGTTTGPDATSTAEPTTSAAAATPGSSLRRAVR
ncbi:flagellar hook assembly protein FlgD [Ilumatobacter sp.]|uniref:flagellar hook assembly protein FlgD n=1 Tax=Ilumatobacter sp. TaxID=1967498 RepID=UPI003B52B8A8